jgi:type IV pilus assembly protein PilM
MVGSVIGIEIGNKTIKLIEVTKKAATLRVERFSLIDTPKDSIINGVIHNIDPIHHVIAKEMAIKKYNAKKAVILIQSSTIIIRNAVVDKQPEKIMKELITMRPDDYLPVETTQCQIDFKVVKEFEEEGHEKQELLLVAAPNNIVSPIINLVGKLKLVPMQITIPSEAIAKAFGTQSRIVHDTDGGVLVLDVGGKITTATIVAKNQAVLTRIIEFGLDAINETISNSMPEADREQLSAEAKARYEENVEELIRPQIQYSIISELERILQFYYSRFENTPIKNVYLIGGGAGIKGIKTYVRDALNIPTQKLTEFSTVIEKPDIQFAPYRGLFVNILGAINGI